MERILRRKLDAIARDRVSGAAELTLRGIRAVRQWLVHNQNPSTNQLLEVSQFLLRAQPSMASLLRLSNEVALAVDTNDHGHSLSRSLGVFEKTIQGAPRQIAKHLSQWFRRKDRPCVHTYSYSSTVVEALVRARRHLDSVTCSESRPGNEGFKTAKRLSRAGIKTYFQTDAGLFSQIWGNTVLVLGLDAVLPGWIAGKVGTKVMVARANQLGAPVIFLADTTKFWPEPGNQRHRWEWTFGPDEELWKAPPRNLKVYNLYFELTRFVAPSPVRVLTERGWMSHRAIRKFINGMKISPRLRKLAD